MRKLKKVFKYTCAYCGDERFDNKWFIDNYIFGHKAYFDQECIDMLNKDKEQK
tara:strand:+ start:723 stop:881 length:159 start_codon:yes stop_codon:yes gene_type:complete